MTRTFERTRPTVGGTVPPIGRSPLRRFIPRHNATISALILLVVTLAFTAATGGTLVSLRSLRVIAIFGPELILITIAMGLVLLTKELDLSVGSIYVVTGVILAIAYRDLGLPLWVAALLAVGSGALMGAINGLIVVTTGVTSFIVTLGTMWAFRGFMLVTFGGGTVSAYPSGDGFDIFSVIAGRPFGVPVQLLWLLGITAILAFLRHATRFGNWMQAVGSNARAARMQGVPTRRVRFLVFTLSGLLCGIAGVIKVAHSNQAVPQSGDIVMLTALAGAIVGGVTLSGGRGDVLGPLLGGLTLQVISMGFVMLGVVEFWTQILTAIAVVVTAYAFLKLDELRVRSS